MEVQVNEENVDRGEDPEAVHEKLSVPLPTEVHGQRAAEVQVELIEQFTLDDIERDEGLQAREQLDQETIDSYAEEMTHGVEFPPVDLFHDGTRHWLADGWHRVAAARSINAAHIRANIRQGTRRDALLYAAGSNFKNGLRRSNADKRRAVTMLLKDEEYCRLPDRQLAEHAGVDHKTVGSTRKELEASGEIPQIDERTVKRGHQTYTATRNGAKKPTDQAALDSSSPSGMADESQDAPPHADDLTAQTEEDPSQAERQQVEELADQAEQDPASASSDAQVEREAAADQAPGPDQPAGRDDLPEGDDPSEAEEEAEAPPHEASSGEREDAPEQTPAQAEPATPPDRGADAGPAESATSKGIRECIVEAVTTCLQRFCGTSPALIEEAYHNAWPTIQERLTRQSANDR